jgi:uncharacterized membrane protein
MRRSFDKANIVILATNILPLLETDGMKMAIELVVMFPIPGAEFVFFGILTLTSLGAMVYYPSSKVTSLASPKE